jgi:hypothetical protein
VEIAVIGNPLQGEFMKTATIKPMMPIPITAARITFWAAALFLVLIAVLHILKPEYDPSWRMISEYAIGRFGWVMQLAFVVAKGTFGPDVLIGWPNRLFIIGYSLWLMVVACMRFS